jgi:hypothetical protein
MTFGVLNVTGRFPSSVAKNVAVTLPDVAGSTLTHNRAHMSLWASSRELPGPH